ncbi:MAG: tetratricopeptide repeat protein [Myxococcota bacterium]
MPEESIEEVVVDVVKTLAAAHAKKSRGLLVVRCTGPREVDHAREALLRARAPFRWKSLPAAELDPPDLLGYALHAGSPEGPCFLAYGLPRGRDGRVLRRFVELINVAGRKYVMAPYLMVMILTLDEIRDLNKGAPQFARSRDRMVAWPVQDAASRFTPAVAGGSPSRRGGDVAGATGGVRGVGGGLQSTAGDVPGIFDNPLMAGGAGLSTEDYGLAPWAGAPFKEGDEVPRYIADAPPPAGRRWGRHLAPEDLEGAELLDRCRMLLDQRHTEYARQGLARVAKKFRAANNGPATAECYVLLGRASEMRFDHTVALEWYEQAASVYEQLADDAGVSDCWNMIGHLRFTHGDLDGAFSFFDRAMRRDEEVGDELRMASGLRRIGIILEQRGDLDDALNLYERAAEIEDKNEDRFAFARSLHHQSRIKARKERFDEARDLLSRSLEIKEELEDRVGLATGYHERGNLDLRQGDVEEALEDYQHALELEEELHDIQGIGVTHAQIGLCEKELLFFDRSVRALAVAREIFHRLQSPYVSAVDGMLEALDQMVDRETMEAMQAEARGYVERLLAPT